MPAAPLHETLQRLLGDRFRLESELFGGGMSRVFVAEEPALARRVVVKVLPPDLLDAKSLARFEREVAVTARLQHPHILPIVSAGSADGLSWYIAPFIEGRSLRDRLAKGERLPRAEALRTLAEVAEAVAFAHARGVVHRDIKPANVLVHEGHALLADFGVARALAGEDDGGGITGVETHAGLSTYLPPDLPKDEGADLWALGALAHELCTGVPPELPVHARAVEDRLAVVGGHRTPGARALAACIARALSDDPSARFPSAEAFAAEIARVRALDAAVDRPWTRRVAAAAFVALGAAVALPMLRDRVRDEVPGQHPVAVVVPDSIPLADAWRDSLVVALREWRDVRVAADGETRRTQRLVLAQVGEGRAAGMLLGANGRPVRTLLAATGERGPSLDAARRVVGAALLGDEEPVFAPGSVPGSESLEAWRRFARARAGFARGELAAAAEGMREVLAADPGHRGALVRLAMLNRWSGDTARLAEATIQWREIARGRGALAPGDSLRHAGWSALLAGDLIAACAAFDTLVGRAPEDWDAWFARGECRFPDRRVVADGASPTGWRFVVGREETARAYERAIDLLGGRAPAFVYERLQAALPLYTNRVRFGHRPGDARLVAGPALLGGDTIRHYPTEALDSFRFRPFGSEEAARHSRVRMKRAARRWVEVAPREPRAWYWLALVLEAEGALVVPTADGLSALAALERAEALADAGMSPLRLRADRARLLFKGGRLAEAMTVVRDALDAHPTAEPPAAAVLAPMAALAGARDRLLTYLQHTGGGQVVTDSQLAIVELPPPLLAARARFNAAALSGACDDDVRFGPRRIALEARGAIPDAAARERLVEQIVSRPQGIAMFCTRRPMPPMRWFPSDPHWKFVEAALARDARRFGEAIRELERLAALSDAERNSEVVHAIAWGHAEFGDTLAAYARLESMFGSMSVARINSFQREEEAAGIRRALLLARALAPHVREVDRGAWWLADAPTLPPVRWVAER